MVGLVIVSHSRALAEALVNLVRQVSSPDVPIAIAAGVGEDRQEFGTDAVEISEAIQAVYSPDGVLVMMDLGSAVLSSDMALELLPPEVATRVRFCPAPLVEGCIAAGVQIGLGSDLETVYNEAQQALLPKAEQLGVETAPAAPAPATAAPGEGQAASRVVLQLKNLHGLHARPAARFVQTAASFNAEIRVTNLTKGKGPVSARSLNALATLGAVKDHQIEITAAGPEAAQALESLGKLVEDGFGEAAEPELAEIPQVVPAAAPAALEEGGGMKAIPISEGFALGPFYRYQPAPPAIPQEPAENPEREWESLQRALAATAQAIKQRRQQLKASLGEAQTAIFDAHLLILQDPDLLDDVHRRIFADHANAAAAWHAGITQAAEAFQSLDDPYLKQRAADVLDVGNQVLFALAGKSTTTPIELKEPIILYAQEITPTETSQLDMSRVLGLMTVGGGPTSHSAILARALGIPAVSGVSTALDRLPAGTLVALDGSSGTVWVDPSPQIQAEIAASREKWLAQHRQLLQTSHALAHTRDGQRVEVFANVGNTLDAIAAVQNGAEGVGLLRTEFLFLTRETPPSEAEQMAALRQVGEALGDRPVTVRTLDVGGDKEVPYIKLPPEANPFLGVRAIRMSLNSPELFVVQLRAILRAAAGLHFRIMFPMVANVDEVRQARSWLEKAHQALLREQLPHAWPIETGIMVEIPSAALLSRALAREVDFFSIGTNDLTQYTLAAERGNPMLASLADALHPAVLRLIGEVAAAAHQEGKWVGVCGELAGDPQATAILVGLGVDELSMNAASIPKVKALLRAIAVSDARALAEQALKTDSAAEARQLAQVFLKAHSGESMTG
jgi:phosphoenolpyruvate-protein phosphotransferase/dihydroxyacetone kinase phosphotransfer subunit